jgi:hypothetical protein
VEFPFYKPVAFALTVSGTLDHRPSGMPKVSIQPLLPQHRTERSQQRKQKARVQETSSGDNLARIVLLGALDEQGFIWDCRMIEGKKDGTEQGR